MIATDGYDSYAMFIYMDDQHQWIQADLKPNVPQVAAQAGFDSGQQNLPPVVLPGSGLPEVANWNRYGNINATISYPRIINATISTYLLILDLKINEW